jgi:hypothetical protein
MKYILLALSSLLAIVSTAQDMVFEDVDSTPVKRYATQKVLNQAPNKFISIGYEYQGGFSYQGSVSGGTLADVQRASGLRLAVNAPVISNTKLIANVGANFWRTAFPLVQLTNNIDGFVNALNNNGATSFGVNTTIFKPLNEKNFLVLFGSADVNYIAPEIKTIDVKALTISATAIYGWKKSDNLMWGLGISRTYRMGRIIHVPVLLYNKTFNNKWGTELLLPARGHIRHNINTKSLLMAGYELEGNQYAIYNTNAIDRFLQRGEIKPRLIYERSLFGFWWLSVQAGMRINGRFTVVNEYNGGKEKEVRNPVIGNPFYFNVSLNLVSL